MTKTKHKILSVFLSFCMIISCMVGMSATAYAAANNITINSSEHGSVTAASDSAESGTTVTLTAQPDEGYKLKSISACKGIVSDIFSCVKYKTDYDGSYFGLHSTYAGSKGFGLSKATDITSANKDDIEAARAAYNALTPAQKDRVPSDKLQELTGAETALSEAQVNETSEKINDLPDADKVTASDKEDFLDNYPVIFSYTNRPSAHRKAFFSQKHLT